MHENNLNYILVENDNKEVVGIVNDVGLIEAVSKHSFSVSIKKYVKKVKKIKYDENIKTLLNRIKKEEYLLIYKKRNFLGIINRIDVLWYLKRNKMYD